MDDGIPADRGGESRDVARDAHVPVPPVVLCVDDEPNILSALRRVLRGVECEVMTAGSGPAALDALRQRRADVVISDMRMPTMDGVEFLERVAVGWPEAARILLTGHAELGAAIGAINRGRIFRYITKPWNDAELDAAVRQGLELVGLQREKHRLEELTAAQNLELRALNDDLECRVERRTSELAEVHRRLKQTFLTSIKVFSNLLELRGGRPVGHGRRVGNIARDVARAMGLDDQQVHDIFLAGMLHDLGHIGLPDALLGKPVARLSPDEWSLYCQHPLMGEQSLMALEEMQSVASLIRAHHERHDGNGYPDRKAAAAIPLGARILAIVDTYDEMQEGHLGGATLTAKEARLLVQQGRGTQFDPEVLDVFLQLTEVDRPRSEDTPRIVGSDELASGMVLAGDVLSPQGVLLLSAGHELNAALIQRVRAFEARSGERFRLQIRRDKRRGRLP